MKNHADSIDFSICFDKAFYKMNDRYTSGVRGWIKKAPLVIILLVCIIVGDVFLFKSKPTGFIPTEDEGRVYITFEIPEASSTTRTLNVMDSMMHIIKNVPGVGHYAALGGLNVLTFGIKSNSGSIFMQLKPWDERKEK